MDALFSEEKLDIPAKEKKTVEIEVLTGKTMLVPREVFDAKAAPALMRINGMEPTEKECILTSDPQQPVIALMAADKASVEKVRARLKEKIRNGPPRCYVPGNSRHPASGYSVMKSWPT